MFSGAIGVAGPSAVQLSNPQATRQKANAIRAKAERRKYAIDPS